MITLTTIHYILDQSDKDLLKRFYCDTDHESIAKKKDIFLWGSYLSKMPDRVEKFWYGSVDLTAKEFNIRRLREGHKLSVVEIKGQEIDDFYQKSLIIKFRVPLGFILQLLVFILFPIVSILFSGVSEWTLWVLFISTLKIGDVAWDLHGTITRLEAYIFGLSFKRRK